MRVLVAGRTGQVAQSLMRGAERRSSLELIAIGRPDLDLEDTSSIAEAVAGVRPDVVVNAAAYTAVDRAEHEPVLAHRINAIAAGALARSARDVGAPIIHLSTDYVFDGRKTGEYQEDDATNPLGVYGRSKLEGEERVRAEASEHLIVRTAWVYSPFGHNFVKTMLRLAETRDSISVVDDQLGNPTAAADLAEAILNVIEGWRTQPGRGTGETYHLAGNGSCSWAGFAEEIFAVSRKLDGPTATVVPIAGSDYPTPACRPANSRLDSGKFERTFGFAMPPWQQSVSRAVRQIVCGDAA